MTITIVLIVLGAIVWLSVFLSMLFRTVVNTNEVHIVQKKDKDVSYGKWKAEWNVYYNWPSWVPFIGIERIILPVSIFSITLENYEAYDADKVPFVVDVMAFFKINDSSIAAQRVLSIDELKLQLENILQWSIRRVLAQKPITEILEWRWEFSTLFTTEVNKQLQDWWVNTTQNVELMNIEDSNGSLVISNIMAIKTSEIEKTSRIQVAENKQLAETKEIEAQKTIDVNKQEAERLVWEKTAEKEKMVWVANEISKQEVATQQKVTSEKEMEVKKVMEVKQAEINKDVAIVKAEEQKQTEIVMAEWEKQQTITIAEGKLAEKQKEAEWIKAVWLAQAETEKAMQMAPVEAQIALAKEIWTNEGYMNYLLGLKWFDVSQVVWTEKAKALQAADLKVISTSWTPNDGVDNLMDLFGSKWGIAIANGLEMLQQTEGWKALFEKLVWKKEEKTNNVEKQTKSTKADEKNNVNSDLEDTLDAMVDPSESELDAKLKKLINKNK